MKYIALFGLIALQAYTSIQLIEARQDIFHKEDLITETIKQCGEAWLKVP